jgi:hypothetical protein
VPLPGLYKHNGGVFTALHAFVSLYGKTIGVSVNRVTAPKNILIIPPVPDNFK